MPLTQASILFCMPWYSVKCGLHKGAATAATIGASIHLTHVYAKTDNTYDLARSNLPFLSCIRLFTKTRFIWSNNYSNVNIVISNKPLTIIFLFFLRVTRFYYYYHTIHTQVLALYCCGSD